METQIITTEKRSRTLIDDPQYFGGYLNMARLNVYNINNHFASEFKFSLLPEEAYIKNSFLCDINKKNANWNLIHSRILRFLPILKVFDAERLPKSEREETHKEGKDFAKMCDSLKLIFTELQEFRNDYSHYYSTVTKTKRKLSISNQFAEFINENFKRAIEYTKERFKDVLDDEDYDLVKKIDVTDGQKTISAIGLVFLTCMFLEREHAFQFIGKITGLKGTQYNSFLATRETLMAFCIKLPHGKFVSEDKKQALTLDLINELNKCPGILYDVITENAKEQFRPKLDDEQARNLLNNSTNEEGLPDYEDYDKYMESLIKRVRYRNRFQEFALSYIDETNLFSKYKFHLNLGKVLLGEYPKLIDGKEETRRIVENVKAFGQLNRFADQTTAISKVITTKEPEDFELFAPRFHKTNNRIALYTQEETSKLIYDSNRNVGKKLKNPSPCAFLSTHELPKIILLNYLRQGEPEKLIDDFLMANNQLLTMPFIEKIKSELPKEWTVFKRRTDSKKSKAYYPETLDSLLSRKHTLNQILKPFHLNDKQIPSRIIDYWLNIVDVNKEMAVSERIKLMKRDCMSQLKKLKRFREERKGRIPKIGEMATFLAKDIVGMIVSEEKKNKITSFYYDKMQECLALWADAEKKELFIHLVTNELKLNEAGGHPFLFWINLQTIRRTSDFYEKYLTEKAHKMVGNKDISWMEQTFYKRERSEKTNRIMTVVKIPDDKTTIPFSIRQLEEKNDYPLQQWLNHIQKGKEPTDKKRAVNLPTNLFDKRIAEILKNALNKQEISYKPNAYWNELFKVWWESRNDSSQEYYKSEREYVIYEEKVRFIPNRKPQYKDYYSAALESVFKKKQRERKKERERNRRLPEIQLKDVEKTFKRTIAGTEKEIRIIEEQDRISLLMLDQLFGNEHLLDLKLNSIDTLLNDPTTISERVSGKLWYNIDGTKLTDNNKPEITRTIITTRKQKDYSILKRFVFDRRLPELFEYFNDQTIPMETLKEELNNYNLARQMVFDTVFKLEEKIMEKHTDEICNIFSGIDKQKIGNIQHTPYLDWLLKKELIDTDTRKFIKMVRDCFSHNQFPQKKTMERLITSWGKGLFAETIAKTYNQKIEEIMAVIEKT